MEADGLVHLNPVWRERANFIIGALLPPDKDGALRKWEQLWARQLGDDHFEICCIPFFVYDLALGDKVETASELGSSYIVQRVIERSGHWTLRVWFGDAKPGEEILGEVLSEIHQLGCPMEFYSANLLAISAPTEEQAIALTEVLSRREHLGHLHYETGWS